MKNLFAAAILSSAVLAAPAHAVSFVATNGSAEVFAASARGAQVTFEAPAATGFSVTGGNTRSGNEWNVGANPFGAPDANTYMYVLAGGTATIAAIANAYQSISFYMGSIDSGNQVEVLGAGGKVLKTYSGSVLSDPAAATGDQTSVATNRLLTFSAGANEQLTGLRFSSSVNSLELDNVRFSAAVPEPATWAMMILGFGVVGYSMRRRPQARPQAI